MTMVAITATATTASVVITGDAAANDLAVDATAGQIVITGANSTSLSVRLNGGAAQSLAAGTPFTQTIPGTITTIDVTANLNDGDDSLTVSSNAITKLRTLTVDLGTGSDHVDVTSTNTTVTGAVKITTGPATVAATAVDNDRVELNFNGTINIGGDLGIFTGTDDDEVVLNTSTGTTLTAATLTTDLGEGADVLSVIEVAGSTMTINGAAKFTTGPAATAVADNDEVAFAVLGTMIVRGDLSFTTGDESDEVNIEVGGSGSLTIGTATLASKLMVDLGMGSDTMNLNCQIGSMFKVFGDASVIGGEGNDFIDVLHPSTTLDFAKNLTIDAGNGANHILFGRRQVDTDEMGPIFGGAAGTLHVGSNLTLNSGSGRDEIRLSDRLLIDGSLLITSGGAIDEADQISIETGNGIVPEVDPPTVANIIKTGVIINTGDGDDAVTLRVIQGTSLAILTSTTTAAGATTFTAGDLKITTAAGNDHVNVNLSGSLDIGKDLTVNTGVDSDEVFISFGSMNTVTVQGDAMFDTGAGMLEGDDELIVFGAFNGVDFDPSHLLFNKKLTITTGADDDLVNFIGTVCTVKDATSVEMGDGKDIFRVEDSSERTLDLQKNVTINTGAGDDVVDLSGGSSFTLDIGGDLTINTGTEDDQVDITGKLLIDGVVSITTGAGEDSVSLTTGTGGESSGTPVENLFKKDLKIDTGLAGIDNDSVFVEVVSGTSLTLGSTLTVPTAIALSIITGLGSDIVEIHHSGTTLKALKSISIDTGAGAGSDQVLFNFESNGIDDDANAATGGLLELGADLKILTGGSDDQVLISDSLKVTGEVNIDTGSADDIVRFLLGTILPEGATGTPISTVTKAFKVATGVGADHLSLEIAGSLEVTGDLNLSTGANSDFIDVTIREGAGGTLLVHGTATIDTGSTETEGFDHLQINGGGSAGITIDKTLTITTGTDHDDVVFLNVPLTVKGDVSISTGEGEDFLLFQNGGLRLNLQKNVTIDTGSGSDSLVISGDSGTLDVGGDFKINSGANSDFISIVEELLIDGAFSVLTGDGRDTFLLTTGQHLDAESPSVNLVMKELTIDTGADNDVVSIIVSASAPLTVNGAALSTSATGVSITTGSGSDRVQIENTEGAVFKTLKDFKVDTGVGNDFVAFNHDESTGLLLTPGLLDVGLNFTVLTGNGDDRTRILETLKVVGDVNLDTGNGNDEVRLLAGTALGSVEGVPDNTIGKDLKINTGAGGDDITLDIQGSLRVTGTATGTGAASVNGGVVITSGAGADRVNLTANADLTILKDLKIDAGLNADDVHVVAVLGSILIQGNETITLGDATASAAALGEGCFIQGTQAVLDSIAGGDPVPPEVTFTVQGNLTISGGNDDDVIGVVDVMIGKSTPAPTEANPDAVVITGGNVTVNAGGGNDAVGGSVLTIFGILTVNGGAGDDTIAGERLSVTGNTVIDAGAGKDRVAIGGEDSGDTTFNGNVTVTLGTGNDQVDVGAGVSQTDGKTTTINGGVGSDELDNASDLTATLLSITDREDVDVDAEAIRNAIIQLFQNCLNEFGSAMTPIP